MDCTSRDCAATGLDSRPLPLQIWEERNMDKLGEQSRLAITKDAQIIRISKTPSGEVVSHSKYYVTAFSGEYILLTKKQESFLMKGQR